MKVLEAMIAPKMQASKRGTWASGHLSLPCGFQARSEDTGFRGFRV